MIEQTKNPPRLAHYLLKRLSPPHLGETALGDYDEMFSWKTEKEGPSSAKRWYWKQALDSIPFSLYWGAVMLHNYSKIAWRNIKRHKTYSMINIAGMALGMACCILILLWIQDELSWDRFHDRAENIYLVSQRQYDGHLTPVTPMALAAYLKNEYPEVKNSVRFMNYSKLQFTSGDRSFAEEPVMADPSFFQMFSYDFTRGRPETALNSLNSIVISEELAYKLYGSENPLGKTITVNNRSDFEVSGVIKNVPVNSIFQFDCVLPIQLFLQGRPQDDWKSSSLWTYIQLEEDSSSQKFNEKISGIVQSRNPENDSVLDLKPFLQLHLRPWEASGPIIYIYIFSAMAVFVLLIACINFINLTTARSSNRAKEVALRKVIGAKKNSLMRQFFGESFLYSLSAVCCALFMVYFFLPAFNNLSNKSFNFGQDIAGNTTLLLGILFITLFAGFFSGFYPAILLSSFQPAKVLKSSEGRRVTSRSPLLRRFLVIFQFSLSIFLMIGTFTISRQLSFIRSRDLGFEKNLIVCSDSSRGGADPQTLKNELLRNPNVLNVTFSSQKMGDWESGAREDVKWEGRPADLKITFEVLFCDYDYLESYSMELVEGRFFSEDFVSDQGQSFILNETAVKEMGFGHRSPLGKNLSFWNQYSGSIIGVIKDFHTQSLQNKIQPVIMAYNPSMLDNISIRISPEDIPETLLFLQEKWREISGGNSFDFGFLNERLDGMYQSEIATGKLLGYFTLLAIFISCIGLLGLISFMALQRTKEIGIRKVLGASVPSLVVLLTREFVFLVVLSNVLAWPLAYWMLKKWMSNFAYQTSMGLGAFALSGGIALIIALTTASLQSLQTARANPTDSLRYE